MAPSDFTKLLRERQVAMEQALRTLVDINTYSDNGEGQRQMLPPMSALFPFCEAETMVDQNGRMHACYSIKGDQTKAPLVLIGHLDTVFQPGTFEGLREDGPRLRGPGVYDMKGGIVVIAEAISALCATRDIARLPPIRVVVVGDEEIGSPFGKAFLAERAKGAKEALVFESGRAEDRIVLERKGTGSFLIVAHGKSAHAGNHHEQGVNAIWMLSEVIVRAQRLTNYATGFTISAGVVRGGTSKNTVPGRAEADVDFRFLEASQREALYSDLQEIAERIAKEFPGGRIEFVPGPSRLPLRRTDASEALARRYALCAKEAGLGFELAPMVGGGSDANTCAELGIAAIDALGPRGKGFHTEDEQIERDTLVPKAIALASFLASYI
jgi:glutamate carboxypeptidase